MEIVLIFLIGLCVGSFLNVLIDRLPRSESIIKGRSYCESCKKRLKLIDLIPVISYVQLKGKCRYCGSPISFYYPLVELITGVLFVLIFNFSRGAGSSFAGQFLISQTAISNLIYYFIIVSSLIVIFFTDIKYGIIPDKILYPAILITLLFVIFSGFAGQFSILNYIISALGSFLFFLLLYLATKGKGMGFGDVKVAFFMGLFLGFPKIITALYMAFLTGAFISLILVIWRKKKFYGGTIPFGPFLVFGTFLALFFGNDILRLIFPGIF